MLEKERTLPKEGGERFFVKVRARVTMDRIEDLAHRIRIGNAAEENKKVLEEYARIEKELDDLKRQIVETKNEPTREVAVDKIRVVEQEFRQIRSKETALYKRLLSGDELSEQVDKSLLAQQKKIDDDKKRRESQGPALNHLLELLQTNGFIIAIGPPEPEVALYNPDTVHLGFPVTFKASDEVTKTLKELGKAYSGDIPLTVEVQVQKVLAGLTCSLTVILRNGVAYTGGPHKLDFKSLQTYDLKLVIQEGPEKMSIPVAIPRQFIQQVSSVEGRIASR